MDPRPVMRCPHHAHAVRDHGVSRRQFFGTTAGLALGAGLSPALGAQGNPHTDDRPRHIPGGVSPFGVLIHHFPIAPPGTPLANIQEPSQITDFNGFVGLNRIRGMGVDNGGRPLSYQSDMGFMVGEYVGLDGKHYNASFGFIWLDLYTGPVGTGQIHDYNPHIDANGLFWTILVPHDAVDVHLGSGQASFRLTAKIPDDHDLKSSLTGVFPPGYPQNADVTFDVEWSNILDSQHIRNDAMNFEGDFLKTDCTIEWNSSNPATGFAFTSEAANPSRTLYAVIGRERNGVFFE